MWCKIWIKRQQKEINWKKLGYEADLDYCAPSHEVLQGSWLPVRSNQAHQDFTFFQYILLLVHLICQKSAKWRPHKQVAVAVAVALATSFVQRLKKRASKKEFSSAFFCRVCRQSGWGHTWNIWGLIGRDNVREGCRWIVPSTSGNLYCWFTAPTALTWSGSPLLHTHTSHSLPPYHIPPMDGPEGALGLIQLFLLIIFARFFL